MNWIGIFALILGLVGVVVTSIGVYFMFQDNTSTSTRSTYWTAAGGIVLILSLILIIISIVMKGRSLTQKKEKVEKRVKIVKRKVVDDAISMQQAEERALLEQQLAAQQEAEQQTEEIIYEYPEQRTKTIEYAYVPNFTEGAPAPSTAEKEVKKLSKSLEELGRKLEGQQQANALVQQTRAREKEVERSLKQQKKEREMEISNLKEELRSLKIQDAAEKEKKDIRKEIKREIKKASAQSGGVSNLGLALQAFNKGVEGFANPQIQTEMAKLMGQVVDVATKAGTEAAIKTASAVAQETVHKSVVSTARPLSNVPSIRPIAPPPSLSSFPMTKPPPPSFSNFPARLASPSFSNMPQAPPTSLVPEPLEFSNQNVEMKTTPLRQSISTKQIPSFRQTSLLNQLNRPVQPINEPTMIGQAGEVTEAIKGLTETEFPQTGRRPSASIRSLERQLRATATTV